MAKRYKKMHREPDINTASLMLANIMEELSLDPSSVPLDVMTSYSNYRRERHVFQKVLLIIILVIFTLLPLLFIAPKYTVTQINAKNASPEYRIDLSTNFPVSSISAVIDSYSFAVLEDGNHVYRIQPSVNGDMRIRVTLLNSQYRDVIVPVQNVDSETPHLVDGKSNVRDGNLYLYVSDKDSEVNYKGVYALGPTGTDKILPDEYDEEEGLIVFKSCPDTMNIYVPDTKGNVLQVVLSFR